MPVAVAVPGGILTEFAFEKTVLDSIFGIAEGTTSRTVRPVRPRMLNGLLGEYSET